MRVYLNGEWCDAADAVYETARLHRGRYFRLGAHLERLAGSAAILRIPLPPLDVLDRVAGELARVHAFEEATLRITVTRAIRDPERQPGTVLVTLRPLPDDWRERADRGWTVVTAAARRPPTASIPARLKSPGRPYATIARFEARDAGADDALLLDAAGDVCEGPTWNVFWCRGDRLFTPSLDVGVLAGVTRAAILELAPTAGLAVAEGRFPRADLERADELFATMSSLGVVPFRTLDARPLPSPAPIAAALQQRYWALVARESTGPA